MKLLEKMKIDKVVAIFTCSCSFCMSAAMYTSFLVEREAGIPPSLPPSSNEARLEVEEAELGRGLAGSLVASGQGVLVRTYEGSSQHREVRLDVNKKTSIFKTQSRPGYHV